MIISSFFTEDCIPKEWLLPTIDVWDVSKNTKIIDSWICEEVWWWFYKYNFQSYSPMMRYSMIIDW